MYMSIKRHIFFSLILMTSLWAFLPRNVNAQVIKEWGLGPSVIYNYAANEFGFGLRSHLILSKEFTISPQIQYFPGFNQYSEMYLGIGAHSNTTPLYRWGLYGLAYVGLQQWFNHENFVTPKAKASNLALEPGIGVVRNKGCLRPFGEARYNTKWKEGTVRIGIMWFFGSCMSYEACSPVYSFRYYQTWKLQQLKEPYYWWLPY